METMKPMNLRMFGRGAISLVRVGATLLLLLALLVGLTACGDDTGSETEPPQPPPATEVASGAAGDEPATPTTEAQPTTPFTLTRTTATQPMSETATLPADGMGDTATGEEEPPTTEEPTSPPSSTSEGEPALPTDTPAPVAGSKQPLSTPNLEFGVVAHLYYTDHERALQLAENGGFDWIRQQIVWKDMEMFEPEHKYIWDQLDPIVEATNAYGLKLLISVVQSPAPYNPMNGLPQDPAALGNFVEAMALRYGDKIHAYEIWNEQNLAHETGGTIVPEDVGHYVEILMECYTRIKAVNPNAYVLAGAPSSTGFTRPDVALSDLEYYQAMYTYRDGIIHDYFDVQAVHPGGSANPPETLWPDNPSTAQGWTDDSTFYYRHIEHVREVMEAHGMGDHQIWITEFGWATANNTPGYEFGNQVSLEQQAEYITGAVQYSYDNYPWLGNMFLWNLNFAVTWQERLETMRQQDPAHPDVQLYWNEANPAQPLHEQASFGILNGDWSPRPAFTQLQQLMAQMKAEQGR
jgi:hypothetical protein